MIAEACAVVEPGGIVRVLRGQPPLTLRRVHSDDPRVAALCLVGSAAGPLAGDRLHLAIDVHAEACATLTAAGATLAQGGASQLHTRIAVADGATLLATPAPLIVCAGARVDVRLDLDIATTATLTWRELLVLGRSGEPPGLATMHWNVTRAGAPLLRQTVDLADPQTTGWAALLRGRRVLETTLLVGPDVDALTIVRSPFDVTQRVADGATLRTVLADQAADLDR